MQSSTLPFHCTLDPKQKKRGEVLGVCSQGFRALTDYLFELMGKADKLGET
jgi:hypothetical protein